MVPMICQQLHQRGCHLHRLLFCVATFLFIHCCCFQNEQEVGGGGGGVTITSALIISSSSSRYQHHHQQQQQQHELGRRSTPAIQNSDTVASHQQEQQEQQQRRTFLGTALFPMMVASVLTSTTLAIGGGVPPAQAKYGEGTRMNMPSYIDYLIDKNTVATTAGALYTGVDPATVLRRIADASQRLTEIETLASQGKWTQIQSILTGPLGTFSSSLAQIGTLTTSTTPPNKTDKPKAKRVAQLITTIKGDLIAIGQAASKKNGAGCIAQTKLASDDIQTLLEVAFD